MKEKTIRLPASQYVVDAALETHRRVTGHDIQFKEEWVFEPDESHEKIILRGHTRFEHAHAIILPADGSKWIQTLGPRIKSSEYSEKSIHAECFHTIGKPRKIREGS